MASEAINQLGAKSNGGAKAFAGVMSIALVVTIVFGISRLQGQQHGSFERRIGALEALLSAASPAALKEQLEKEDARSAERKAEMVKALGTHALIPGHPPLANRVTAIDQKLLEVETQFRHQDRLIQLLWQRTYQEPLPNPLEK